MKNNILKSLSFLLCFLIIITTITVIAAPSNGLTLNIEFSQEKYIVGETATATIYLTGAKDEIESALTLGGIGTNLCFSDNLTFVPDGTVYNYAITNNKIDGDEVFVVHNEYYGKNIINVMITLKNGLLLSDLGVESELTDETKIYIASIEFTVGGSAGERIELKFEDDSLNDNSLPYETEIFDKDLNKYEYTIQNTPAAKDVVSGKAIVRDGEIYYSGDEFIAMPRVFVSKAEGAVLLAKLSYADGMPVAPIAIRNLSAGSNTFGGALSQEEISFNYTGSKENLKITYYIWDSLTGIRCISDSAEFPAVEYNF